MGISGRMLAMLLAVGMLLALAGCQCRHEWVEADCGNPKICAKCGQTVGEPLGHSWLPATYEAPETCAVCGLTRGEAAEAPQAADVEEAPAKNPPLPDETIDRTCDHIIELFPGTQGIEATCRLCGASADALEAAGIEWRKEYCEEECDWKLVMQTNGTPVYECAKCHNISLCLSPHLTDLRLLSDTNAKGKHEDVKYGSFYEKGKKWNNLVRFWVADKRGYTNTESMEVYLAGAYENLVVQAFAGSKSDKDTNMTLRFYGDGTLLWEITDIVLEEESDKNQVKIDVTNINILKVECSTEENAFGYCFLDAVVQLNW